MLIFWKTLTNSKGKVTYENRLLAHQWTKKKGDEVEGIWWILAMLTTTKKDGIIWSGKS